MEWAQTDYLITGIVIGYFLNPFLTSMQAILVNAWRNTGSACTDDCNQGRSCICKYGAK